MSEETWKVAVSRHDSGMDTLWRSSEGRFCITDGTHPKHVEGDLDGYIIDIEKLKKPVVLGAGWLFPNLWRIDEEVVQCYAMFEKYFLREGFISEPITYILPR